MSDTLQATSARIENKGWEVLDASEKLVHALVRNLDGGRYLIGQRLVEPDLPAEFCTGRSTVPTEIYRMEATGTSKVAPYRNALIAKPSAADTGDAVFGLEIPVWLTVRRCVERVNRADSRTTIRPSWKDVENHHRAVSPYQGSKRTLNFIAPSLCCRRTMNSGESYQRGRPI